jgi:hypothetical protein
MYSHSISNIKIYHLLLDNLTCMDLHDRKNLINIFIVILDSKGETITPYDSFRESQHQLPENRMKMKQVLINYKLNQNKNILD